MMISDEIRKLQELHENGVLSEEEFAQAKARVLSGQNEPENAPTLDLHFDRLHLQNELERIDREWQIERQRYVSHHQDGTAQEPSAAGAVLAVIFGIFVIGFLIFWTNGASSIGAPPVFGMFGFFMIAMVVIGIIWSVVNTGSYQEANKQYQQRRNEALAKLKALDSKPER